jgi:FkbM family methyltransferase
MKQKIVNSLKKLTINFFNLIYFSKAGRVIVDTVSSNAMNREVIVKYKNNDFIFTSPNSLNKWRLETFSTKEPETLNWIDGLENNSILWDIGANIGLYSVYAAKVKNCKVYSFEPSVFNLELLARNTFLNGLSDKISIIPLPLTTSIGINKLNMTSTEWGGAISTFGSKAIGHDGKIMNKTFEFSTLGISMDSAVETLNIPMPDYIKMDVDGIEHFILMGGEKVLRQIKGIIIEINDDFIEQDQTASKLLQQCGMRLDKKLHSDIIDKMEEFGRTFNQIWVR